MSSQVWFYRIWIPVAITCFALVPPATLLTVSPYLNLPHACETALEKMATWTKYIPLNSTSSGKMWRTEREKIEVDEIPLIFRHEEYPEKGRSTIKLHEYKYLKLAEKLQHQEAQYFGYIHIFQTSETKKELPTGVLLRIKNFEWNSNGCEVETERKRQFRIKSIRRDKKNGVVYAKVDWLD